MTKPAADISREQIKKILGSLMKDYKVAAPVKEDGKLLFKEVENLEEIVFTDELPYKSPKEFLFPQFERIMAFNEEKELVNDEQVEKLIVFGVKPCDLEAAKIMTAVFTQGKYIDTFYANRLENTIFIGTGCLDEKPGCFCAKRGIDRNCSTACDIFLKTAGDNYVMEAISEKGRKLIEKGDFDESEPSGVQADNKEPADKNRVDNADMLLEIEADEKELFDEINWEMVSERCLGCGICTYICPTCHCFEFKDVKKKETACRYRYWDSCMYSRFTLHASGHNPRPSKKERIRQRVMHKYLYVKKNFGYTACTGCGRCIRSCPAGMNIKSVVSDIMEELK